MSHPATIGRLSQVRDRWIYSACLRFGLDLDEQARRGFTYGYSVYQAEYSRNLIFKAGAQMDKVFDRIVDRTWSRLDVPTPWTLFGAKQRPSRNGSSELSRQLAAMIETPRYDLALFTVKTSSSHPTGPGATTYPHNQPASSPAPLRHRQLFADRGPASA